MGRERVARVSPVRSFADRASASSLAPAITWVGVALQTVWTVAIFWTGSDAASSVEGEMILVLGGFVLMLIWGWRWVIYRREHVDRRSGKWRLAPILMIVLWLFVGFGGAFFVRFLASRPAFDRFASSMAAAGPMVPKRVLNDLDPVRLMHSPAPIEVGTFHVQEVEVLPGGVVRLILGDAWFGQAGVVYCPEGPPPDVHDELFRHSYSSLGGGWWRWHRSW